MRKRRVPPLIRNKSMLDFVLVENGEQRDALNVCNEAMKRWVTLCWWQPEGWRRKENDQSDSPLWKLRNYEGKEPIERKFFSCRCCCCRVVVGLPVQKPTFSPNVRKKMCLRSHNSIRRQRFPTL